MPCPGAGTSFSSASFNHPVKWVEGPGQSAWHALAATAQQDFTGAMPGARNHVDNTKMQQVYCSA